MANKKITDATTATSVAGTDKVFLNQGGDLKQVDLNSAVANSQAVQTLNSNLTQCPTKKCKDYSDYNQSFEYKINSLSLIFITYANVQSADIYVCRCISRDGYALVPIYKTGNLDYTYNINLNIESRILTITSKRSWIQVNVISL